MRNLFILLLALLAIAAIAYFCVYKTHVPAIQEDIASRAKAALTEKGITGVEVAVDGRDINLTGTVDNAATKQLAEQAVQVNGYNFISNNLKIAGDDSAVATTPAKKYSLGISLADNGKVTLDGILDSKSHNTLHQAATTRYGKENVTDRILELDIPVAKGMPDAALLMLDKMSGLQSGRAMLVDQQIDIKGMSPSKMMLAEISKQLKSQTPSGYTLNLDLTAADSSGSAKPVAALSSKSCQRKLNKILRRSKIHFNSGSAVIKKSSYKTLNKLARVAKQCPGMRIKIHGHTDSTGRNSNNRQLSKKRARAVANYLIKKGIAEKNLVAIGHGSSKPVASNKTSRGRARNRRIELTVERLKQ